MARPKIDENEEDREQPESMDETRDSRIGERDRESGAAFVDGPRDEFDPTSRGDESGEVT